MWAYRRFLVVGSNHLARRSFSCAAVQIAHQMGWRGRDFLVGFEAETVGKLLGDVDQQDALAVAITGSILERIATAQSVSSSYDDAIVCHDWYGSAPYFDGVSDSVMAACELCYEPCKFNSVVSCSPKNEIKEIDWIEDKYGSVIDLADSPKAFACLIIEG